MLNVAVIGLGVGEQHARSFAAAGCCVRWLYDLDPARTASSIARLGFGQAAPSFAAVLGDPGVDLVSIASYDDAHATQVVEALRAGKHVFVEKPLCRTEGELTEIRDAWLASGRALCSNLVLRAAPAYRWLRDAIAKGELGEVYAFDADYLYGRLWKVTEGWRKDVPDYSVMQGGGIHLLDLMLWLTGQRPFRVTAQGNRIASRGTASPHVDFHAASFEFPSTMVGRITANFGCVHRHQHVVRVFGTKATFVYDDLGPRLHTERRDGAAAAPLSLDPLPSGKGDLIPEFAASIASGRNPSVDVQQVFDGVSLSIAAVRALEAGHAQTIHYL